MYKRLRMIVPAVQVLIVVAVYTLPKLSHTNREFDIEIFSVQNLVKKLNFPLVVIWSPVLYGADWLSRYLPPLRGALFAAAVLVVAALLASSVALFWYFVLTEIEMRRHGKSMLRLTGWFKELFIASLLFCFGAGSILHAYAYTRSLFHVRPAEAVLGGFFLLAWGVAFIGVSVHDIVSFSRNKGAWIG
jgi:hypothetical protein